MILTASTIKAPNYMYEVGFQALMKMAKARLA
jgi:hypothetical protein